MTARRALEDRLEAWKSFRGIARAARTLAAAQVISWKARVEHVTRHLAWTTALLEHELGPPVAADRRVGVAIGTDLGLCGRMNAVVAEALLASPWANRPVVIVGSRLADELPDREPMPQLNAPASFEAVEVRAAEVAMLLERIVEGQSVDVTIVLAASTTADGAALVETWSESPVAGPEAERARASLQGPVACLPGGELNVPMVTALHLRARLAHALCVAAVSEANARLFAMTRAFEASDRGIAAQTLALRKLTQESVTQDMLEVRRAAKAGGGPRRPPRGDAEARFVD
ncbi:MAG: hypothetical protein B7733_05535 [Myxococcales bacterium FL481]|nr:MAG: hypothetical protein B7733_05535 [Myxococcales bacterium FL481]